MQKAFLSAVVNGIFHHNRELATDGDAEKTS